MEVICINDKIIKHKDGSISLGTGLIQGDIYNYTDIVIGFHGCKAYVINNLGNKLCERFVKINLDWVEEILKEETTIESLL